jgi:hypothetical protein
VGSTLADSLARSAVASAFCAGAAGFSRGSPTALRAVQGKWHAAAQVTSFRFAQFAGCIRRRKVPRLKLWSRFVQTHPECVSTRREICARDGEARALFLKGRSRGRAEGVSLKL